jgi:hypothetical protein
MTSPREASSSRIQALWASISGAEGMEGLADMGARVEGDEENK